MIVLRTRVVQEAEETEPGGALAQNIDHTRRIAVVHLDGNGPATRHEEHPHGQPQHAAKSQSQEEHAPPEAGHQQASQKRSDGGAGPGSRVDRDIRQAAAAFGKRRQNARVGGVGHGFAHAQQQPQREQRRETLTDSRSGGGGGPEPLSAQAEMRIGFKAQGSRLVDRPRLGWADLRVFQGVFLLDSRDRPV